jgi:hypothetical protein
VQSRIDREVLRIGSTAQNYSMIDIEGSRKFDRRCASRRRELIEIVPAARNLPETVKKLGFIACLQDFF